MPAVYIAAARAHRRLARRHRRVMLAWVVAVAAAALLMYPFTPLP